ncbi:MAG: hypothetical protein WC304_03970 [Candidatus Gracilibacteria bacterium]
MKRSLFIELVVVASVISLACAFAAGYLVAKYSVAANPPSFQILEESAKSG